ncbi:MAG: hypothetical protein AAB834_01970 [Patescibacteria group bacterium]
MANTQLIGKAKELEVAGLLVANSIYVYLPLIDNGYDLLASNRKGTKFIPVQVKWKKTRSGLTLTKKDIARFTKTSVVLAFGRQNRKEEELAEFWFLPFKRWRRKAVDRQRNDEKVYIPIQANMKWLSPYRNDLGVRKAFASLLADG